MKRNICRRQNKKIARKCVNIFTSQNQCGLLQPVKCAVWRFDHRNGSWLLDVTVWKQLQNKSVSAGAGFHTTRKDKETRVKVGFKSWASLLSRFKFESRTPSNASASYIFFFPFFHYCLTIKPRTPPPPPPMFLQPSFVYRGNCTSTALQFFFSFSRFTANWLFCVSAAKLYSKRPPRPCLLLKITRPWPTCCTAWTLDATEGIAVLFPLRCTG